MILETERIVTDWLNDGTNGVNALLPGVPRDAGDDEPPAVKIIIDRRDTRVADWQPPNQTPAIYVAPDGPAVLEGMVRTTYRDGDDIPVSLRYFTATENTTVAAAHTQYTLRAMIRSLRALMRNEHTDDRKRNDVHVRAIRTLHAGEFHESIGNARVTGVVIASFDARDLNP